MIEKKKVLNKRDATRAFFKADVQIVTKIVETNDARRPYEWTIEVDFAERKLR